MQSPSMQPRNAAADEPLRVAGIASVILAVAMLLAMIPGLAHVSIEGPIVPAPVPAPSPAIVIVSAD